MKNLSFLVVIALVVVVGVFMFKSPSDAPNTANLVDQVGQPENEQLVKEFALTSFYEQKDGAPRAGFSLNDIEVKKGDLVRIKVTNVNGIHDFNIDEYQITTETPLNQETVIEFTADKAGEFKYYCSKFNHRQIGQEGTLRVIE